VTYTEIEAIHQLQGRTSLDHCVLQGLDLTGEPVPWAAIEVTSRTFFLGCRLRPGDETDLRARGAVFFPRFGELPFDPYRARLYDTAELLFGYDGQGFESATDQKIYLGFRKDRSIVDTLAQALHDHHMEDALGNFVDQQVTRRYPRGIVGIMGGHAIRRSESSYEEIARLSHRLTREGFLVLTGGGPGAMEAANLGAFLVGHDEAEVANACANLAPQADFHASGPYHAVAQEVIRRFAPEDAREWGFTPSVDSPAAPGPRAGWSLAIPTWVYGHEPTNLFASHVAKMFQNSVREAGLVRIATAGLVFAPGKAGTLQEIFTDTVENYYATRPEDRSPMAFWPRAYWTDTVPAIECLHRLAAAGGGNRFVRRVRAFDAIGDIVGFLKDPPAAD
jgi:predicted Rossmann-fold nucleotide-binding protein